MSFEFLSSFSVNEGSDLQMHIPKDLSFEEASTVSLGAITVGQGLYQKALKLALPTEPIKSKEYVLIYGGPYNIFPVQTQQVTCR
jgi:NADPH:quinone reductase-like Zn-dependent oxidoreductase